MFQLNLTIESLYIKASLNYQKIKKKLHVSKHPYECSNGIFKIMPIYLAHVYSLPQIKENIIDILKPTLNLT